jgi:hypothetical protein
MRNRGFGGDFVSAVTAGCGDPFGWFGKFKGLQPAKLDTKIDVLPNGIAPR